MAIICLDADGTIIDTLSVEAIYYVGAFQQLGFDFVKNVDDLKKLYCNNYFEECKKHKIDQETVWRLDALYRAGLESDNVKIDLFPDMGQMIGELGRRFPLYIVSCNDSGFIDDILNYHGVTGVKKIIGNDKETSKTATFQRLRRRYPGEKIIFAGDTKGDILEGKRAGLDLVIGVTYGWGYQKDLAEAGADVLVDSVGELRQLLEATLASA